MRQVPGVEGRIPRGRPRIRSNRKSIDGLQQFPAAWDAIIYGDSERIGFTSTAGNLCVYAKRGRDDYSMLLRFANNLLLITKRNKGVVANARWASITEFTMTDAVDATRIVRVVLTQKRDQGTISISQYRNILWILEVFGMAGTQQEPARS